MSECNMIAQSPFGGSEKDEEDRMECRLCVALNTEVITLSIGHQCRYLQFSTSISF